VTDILDYISTWSALKWVVLVLIAGFIGQFGRMMAEAIIARVRRTRAGKKMQREEPALLGGAAAAEISSVEHSSARPSADPVQPPAVAASPLPDKKALKTLAKARKKEAKEAQKEAREKG
jgi:hypothetical protein